MRRALKDLFAFLLRDTPEHAEFLAFRLQLFKIRQAMEDLLLRLVTNGAGVVEDEVGLVHGLDLAIALLQQGTNDLLRVVDVHLTTERLQIETLLRICFRNPRHTASIARQNVLPQDHAARISMEYGRNSAADVSRAEKLKSQGQSSSDVADQRSRSTRDAASCTGRRTGKGEPR